MKITLQEAEQIIKEINDKIEDQQFAKNGQAFGVSVTTDGSEMYIVFLNNTLCDVKEMNIENIDDLKDIVEANLKAIVESISAIKI